jgi:hypothetical protein
MEVVVESVGTDLMTDMHARIAEGMGGWANGLKSGWMAVLGLLLGWGTIAAGPGQAAVVELVPAGALWRWQPGTSEASSPDPTRWRAVDFSDAAWRPAGPLPLFYGEPLNGTLIEGMQNSYSSVFVRRVFTVTNPGDFSALELVAACDDGFVAWLNGQEVARYNVPGGDLTFQAFANGAVSEPAEPEVYPIGVPRNLLRPGNNVLAVQVFNATLGSSDLVFDARLTGTVDEEPPVISQVLPEPGTVVAELTSVEIQFSESVTGVEAADLLINGVPAQSVSEPAQGQFVFRFASVPPGSVTVAFRSDHGIRDRSTAARPFAGGSWNFSVDPLAAPPTLVISEFLADNDSGLRDDDGERSDWIELQNLSSAAVSVGGWALTDDAKDPQKWVLPNLAVPARGYLLVWASARNRTNPAAPLHTNFRLANNGEYLALRSPGGQVASEFAPAFPEQRSDVAYGRLPGSGLIGFLPEPTPRAANRGGGPGFAPDVRILATGATGPVSAAYTGVLEVALELQTNGPTAGSVIRYTTDGTLPQATSAVYGGPLRFTNAVVQVRARAFNPGLFPGTPVSETFLALVNSVATFSSDLPVLIIHDFNRGRPPANSRVGAWITAFERGTNGLTSLRGVPQLSARAGISVRGSSTEGIEKASLRVEFQDEFGNDQDVSPLGLPAEADWILYAANFFEPVLIHNPFMHQLSRDIGRYSPRTRLCEVYLVTVGTNAITQASYNGVYVLEERIEIGGDRVDLGRLLPENLTPPTVTGGYLMKIDRLDPGDSGISAGDAVVGMVEPKEVELRDPARRPQLDYLTDYMGRFANALNGANYRHPVNGYAPFIDEGSWIDHHLLNVLAFNVDALRLSTYFGKRREGRIEFGPLWDFDRALGSTDGRDANPRVWATGDGTDFFNFQPWWGRLFTDPDFYQRYIDRYQELRRAQFATTNLTRLTDQLGAEVRRAAARDWARWGASPRAASHQGEVNLMKTWLTSRMSFMDSQFVAPPGLGTPPGPVEPGTQMSLTAPVGREVFYTLDGSDPRAVGGGIAPGARLYTEPFVIDANRRVVARSRNLSHTARTGALNPPLISTWSGPVAGTYFTSRPPLICSEIHFQPRDEPEAAAGDFEFVELLNRGTETVDLTGYALRGGITFLFSPTNPPVRLAPGERTVLVRNLAAFNRRYPGVTRIAGQFTGQLANEGDRLALFAPLEVPAFDFTYRASWWPLTAGPGHSLVPAEETLAGDPSQAGYWRASAQPDGSPGKLDAASLPAPPSLGVRRGADDSVELGFLVPAGRAFELQAQSVLGQAGWQFEQRLSAQAVDRTESLRVVPGDAPRYYRLVNLVE